MVITNVAIILVFLLLRMQKIVMENTQDKYFIIAPSISLYLSSAISTTITLLFYIIENNNSFYLYDRNHQQQPITITTKKTTSIKMPVLVLAKPKIIPLPCQEITWIPLLVHAMALSIDMVLCNLPPCSGSTGNTALCIVAKDCPIINYKSPISFSSFIMTHFQWNLHKSSAKTKMITLQRNLDRESDPFFFGDPSKQDSCLEIYCQNFARNSV
jgi:hypothetical protein